MTKTEVCEALERAISHLPICPGGENPDAVKLRTLKERIERGEESDEWPTPKLIIDWSGREGEAG